MRDALVPEQAQDVGEGVHHPQAGEVAGVAQVLFRDCGHVHVFHGGMRELAWLEDAGQFVQARIRHLRHAHASGGGADSGVLADSGKDGEQGSLAYHGQADNSCLHKRI
jgi:hypothetical protein